MKMQALLSAVWGVGLLLALNGASMVSARHNRHTPQTMFVFGDSFVDNGNLPRADLFDMSRQWYYPYGLSYLNDDGSAAEPNPTGRFSDFLVQSDFVANMLGLHRSPPTYQSTGEDYCDPSGMNFAFADAGVYRFEFQSTTVREQVNIFKEMIHSGAISRNLVAHSIALLAVSGRDYKQGFRNNKDFIGNVTTEIAANVERLQQLGVKRILVNNMHPLGCTPSQTRPNNYKACNNGGNKKAQVHNADLKQKLGAKNGVFIVDLYTAFNSIIGHATDNHQFEKTREPCCISKDPKGYCGQKNEHDYPIYTVCSDPSNHFFWDDMHPTHAGWVAVMMPLYDSIREFIGL